MRSIEPWLGGLLVFIGVCCPPWSEGARAQEPVEPAPAGEPVEPAPAGEPVEPAPAGEPAERPATEGSTDEDTDALVEELLSTGSSEDDLAWLFSDASEYAEPSPLAGKPIPAPGLPGRGEGSRRTWDPRWRRFAFGDYVLTGVSLGIGLASAFIPATPSRWRERNGFDETIRRDLGVVRYERGMLARDTSDLLLSTLIAFPLLFDSLVVMYWHRQSRDVAGQMALIDAEAIAFAAALQGMTSGLSSRERPYGRDCGTRILGELDDCSQRRRYRSFFSGHTALSFAAAGATCSNHLRHDVFGHPLADGAACATASVAAGMVGMLRIMGDQHYATDVLTGAGLGALSGFGLPFLLHYGPLARVKSSGTAIHLSLVPAENGIAVKGRF